jgi:hypothetical protein
VYAEADENEEVQYVGVDEDRLAVIVFTGADLATADLSGYERFYINDSDDLADLKQELADILEDQGEREVQLIYLYAAADADEGIVGKLPGEIASDGGAYAAPLVRTVTLTESSGGIELRLPEVVVLQQRFENGSAGTGEVEETFDVGKMFGEVQDRVERSNTITLVPVSSDGKTEYDEDDVEVEFEDIAGFETVGTGTKDTLTVNGLKITGKTSGVAKVTVRLKSDGSVLAEVIVVVPGDVNRDGAIDGGDSTALSLYAKSLGTKNTSGFAQPLDEYSLLLADVNRDGAIDGGDSTALSLYAKSLGMKNTSGWT